MVSDWFIYRHVEGVSLNEKFTRPSFLTKPLELKSTKWTARKLTRANRFILLFREIPFSLLYHLLCQGGKPSGDVWEWKNSIKIVRLGCYGKHVKIQRRIFFLVRIINRLAVLNRESKQLERLQNTYLCEYIHIYIFLPFNRRSEGQKYWKFPTNPFLKNNHCL